jgi:hypothetical protein
MISKIKIGIILSSTMVASAMVCYAVAHRHQESAATSTPVNPQVQQIPVIPKPRAGKPLDAEADANQNGAVSDPNTAADRSSDSADDQNQAPADDQADAGNSNHGPAHLVSNQGQTSLHAAAIPAQPIARVRMVHAVHPVVATTSVSADRPEASVESALTSAIVVPTGTELTLRLVEPLGSKISHANQSFAAILDRDVEIHGQIAIPAGARATGKVVFARLAGRFAGEANLQLEIDSIKINRHEFAVRTSVRSFGPIIKAKNKVGRFMTGLAKRMDGEEHDVLLEDQTAYAFTLARPLEIR